MKKMLLTVVVCLASSFGFAEETPPVFSTSADSDETGKVFFVPKNYQSVKYIVVNNSEEQQILFEYYNPEDFSLIKQINFTIEETEYKYYEGQVILDQFIFVVCRNTTDENDRATAKLYDAKGNLIYDFGKANYFRFWGTDINFASNCIWQISSNKILFSIHRSSSNNGNHREFYYLTITETETGLQSVQVEKKAAFPCPAREVVNIPTSAERGHLHIRNTSGKIMKSQSLNGCEYQQVNTSNFPAGTYIYQTEAESGSFIVK